MSGARSAARNLISHGWQPIPVPPRKKGPIIEAWQHLRFGEAEVDDRFRADDNVGLLTGEPSGNLTDIDLDCDEAVALAPTLLPPTPMWSGHSSRHRSHAWFVAKGTIPETRSYKDVDQDKTTLVELRANGRQTVVPPSIHPDGDVYAWEGPLEPAEIDGDEIRLHVERLAAATILARHWPREEGSRHDIANALGGMLIRAGWDVEDAVRFVVATARAANDPEATSRGGATRATAKRIAAGGKATGRPRLVELLGAAVVGRVEEWLRLRGLSAFIEFNAYPPESSKWPAALLPGALHGLAGRYVQVVAPHTEADPAAILVQFLVAFGNCIGRTAYYEVEADRHYMNLFATIVGQTAKGRKGTSWGQVRRLVASTDGVWAKDCFAAGLASGEGLIWRVRDEITKHEPVKAKGGIVTGYQDVVTDPGVVDKRLLVVEPEFAHVLKVINREGNTLSPTIRSAWDTGDLTTIVKNSPAKATGAHISILGHITKDELVRLLENTEAANGFANRFLWVCARRSQLLPDGGSLTESDLVGTMSELREAIDHAAKTGQMFRDDSARTLWHSIYGQLSEGKPGLFGAVVSRAEAQVTRLSCIYALLDCSQVVRREHLEAALALWDYVEHSARFIFGATLGDPVADTIHQALQASPDGLTRNDIRDLFKGNTSSPTISRALGILMENGMAEFQKEATGGRPAERWILSTGYAKTPVNAERVPDPEAYRVNRVADQDEEGESAGEDPLSDEVVL